MYLVNEHITSGSSHVGRHRLPHIDELLDALVSSELFFSIESSLLLVVIFIVHLHLDGAYSLVSLLRQLFHDTQCALLALSSLGLPVRQRSVSHCALWRRREELLCGLLWNENWNERSDFSDQVTSLFVETTNLRLEYSSEDITDNGDDQVEKDDQIEGGCGDEQDPAVCVKVVNTDYSKHEQERVVE